MSLTDIVQPIRKRTKRAYLKLFDNPAYLFGRGTRTIVFPNGEREIWISNPSGTASFKIRASDGPAGFSVTIASAVGTLPTQAHVLNRPDYQTAITPDAREVTLVAYYPDEYSQQFAKWYACDARDQNGVKTVDHPDVLGLAPRALVAEGMED